MTIAVTQYSGVGQDISGNFAGTFTDGSGMTQTVTNGTFRAMLQ